MRLVPDLARSAVARGQACRIGLVGREGCGLTQSKLRARLANAGLASPRKIDRAPLFARMEFERELQLLEEVDPALADILVDARPVDRRPA